MAKNIVDPLYNLQQTELNKVLTAVEVETARPLTLTQDSTKAAIPGYLFLAPTANVTIFGDEVTVSGRLEFPGRSVVIFARILRAEPDGTTPPAISVNGPEQTAKKDQTVQNFKGEQGEHGKIERAPGIWGKEGEQNTDGGTGWSGPDHPEKMNGQPGDPGEPGNAAGTVSICCEQCDFGGDDGKLTITADGGRGGEGQQGQDGAKGGKGGDGADFRDFSGGLGVWVPPTKGGDGGQGGEGGKGGQGGQGGPGGQIVFYSALADPEPKLTLSYAGGPGGTPGKPGDGGEGGPKGIGGLGKVIHPRYGETDTIPNADDGNDGNKGGDKGPGDPAPASVAGAKSVGHGSLESSSLIKIARVSHAQMLFERVRADYLVTEPADYSIQLMVAMSETELPKIGKNLIVVGLVGPGLRIRIFDAKGTVVLDRTEDKLLSKEAVAKFRERFKLRMDEVILTGQWSAQKQLADLSADARHNLFLDELSQLSNGKVGGTDSPRRIEDLNDDELAGALALFLFLRESGTLPQQGLKTLSVDDARGILFTDLVNRFGYDAGQVAQLGVMEDNQKLVLVAKLHEFTNGYVVGRTIPIIQLSLDDMIGALALALFLRETGIRTQQELKTYSVIDATNAIVIELNKRFGYDQAQLGALDNQKLVLLAFGPGGRFNIGESLSLVKNHLLMDDEEQKDFVRYAGLCTHYTDPWTSVGDRLVWVTKLLTAASQAGEDSQKELATLLYRPALMALNNHQDGLDFFGRSESYTPKLSFDTLETSLTASLDSLKTIEVAKNNYFKALRENKNDTNDLDAAITMTGSQISVLSTRKSALKKNLDETIDKIKVWDKQLKGKEQKDLPDKMRKFEEQIKSAFGLSWQTFFNCLGMLSFMNVNEPRSAINTLTKVGGYASAGAMAASQLGAMITEGVDKVLNDAGEPVNKNYVLTEVEVIKGDIRLYSEFKKRENGFLQADSSKRLVVEIDRFRSLCKQFYRSAPAAEELRKELDGFIEMITKRNLEIDYFNSLLVGIRQLAGEIGTLELQAGTLKGKLTKISNPGLPAMASFVSGLYERAKATCISDLYNAFRAKAFWALEPYSGFYDLLGSSPGALTHATLQGYKTQLLADLMAALETARATPNVFPKKEDSMGEVIVLTPNSHEQFFKDLLAQSWAEFELNPATKASTEPLPTYSPTTAAWCGTERPIYAPNAPNPFHGKPNVRLTKVRTWMVGMTTGNTAHEVTTTHLGQEQFRTKADVPYPARTVPAGEPDLNKRNAEYVQHKATPISVKYDPTDLRYDPAKSVKEAFTPGSFTSKWLTASKDGDLGFPSSGLAALPSKAEYAPIGPFGKWRVDVSGNGGLDLKGLTAVIIEMHGFSDDQ
ncbi:MAG: collagen-like protein, partial [Verrucomicrobia bacterium]|nr:collagen-like protein [Verrucomicrobiota bacterium]